MADSVGCTTQDLTLKLFSAAPPSRAMVLWQDAEADVCRQCVVGEGENLSGLNPARTRCLSDEVLTYTPKLLV
jgi:hypothetical protein